MRRKNREINIFNMSALDLFASAMGAFLVLAVVALPYYLKVDPDLIDQLKQCREQLQSTQQQLQQCQAQNQQLQTDNEQLQTDNEQLQTDNEQLQTDNEQLQTDNEQLQTDNEQLQTDNEQLQTDNEQLQTDNEQLQTDNEQLQTDNEQLQTDNEQLQTDNEQLQRDLAKTFLSVVVLWPNKDDIDLHVTDPNGNEFYYAKDNRDRRDFPNSNAQLSWDVVTGPGAEVWDSVSPEAGIYKIEYLLYGKISSSVTVKGKLYYRDGFIDLPAKTLSRAQQKVIAIRIKLDADGKVTLL